MSICRSRRYSRAVRSVLAAWLVVTALALACPATARAAGDEDEPKHDARLDGYEASVTIDGGSTLAYMCLIVVAAAAVGVMFIDAKRSHLD